MSLQPQFHEAPQLNLNGVTTSHKAWIHVKDVEDIGRLIEGAVAVCARVCAHPARELNLV